MKKGDYIKVTCGVDCGSYGLVMSDERGYTISYHEVILSNGSSVNLGENEIRIVSKEEVEVAKVMQS